MKLVSAHKLLLFLFLFSLKGLVHSQSTILSLDQCVEKALANNKQLKISRNNKELSKEKLSQVKGNLLPNIGINGEYKYYTDLPYQLMPLSVFGGPEGQFKEAQFGVPHNLNANIQVTMPIYSPQLYSSIQTVKIASELSEINYQKSIETVFFETSNLYYNAQIIHQQLKFIDSNIINNETLLNTMTLLNEHLLAKESDVRKIQLQLNQLKLKKDILSNKEAQVLNSLKLMMGAPLDSPISIDNTIQYKINNQELASNNVDLKLAFSKSLMVQSELKTFKRSRLPSISMFGSYGTMGYGYNEKPNDFLNFYPIGFVGLKLHYSLFSGFSSRSQIKAQEIEYTNSQLQLSLLKDQTEIMSLNAKLQMEVSIKTIEISKNQMELAKDVYEQIVLQQKQGTANLTEVLMADNALLETQQTYLNSIVEYLKADLDLKKLTGNFPVKK